MLTELNFYEVDGIIVQDFGLAEIIGRYFKTLKLIASTQMAVHNSPGVSFLSENGFSRIILSRELSFEEITRLTTKHPEMEFEVFLHGSLCYSFSGLCLASHYLAGRSGNRGECAQICRSYFDLNGKTGYFFSCSDLELAEEVQVLKNIGIASFKLEGRMKSPEYVFWLVKYYKKLLSEGKNFNRDEKEEYQNNLKLTFYRKSTKGYFYSSSGEKLIDRDFSGHYGLKIGTVDSASETGFTFTTGRALSVYDGLMFFVDVRKTKPFQFSLKKLYIGKKKVFTAKKGETVTIKCGVLPVTGTPVYLLSSRALDLPPITALKYPPFRKTLHLVLNLSKNSETASENSFLMNFKFELFGRKSFYSFDAEIFPSRGNASMAEIFRKFLSPSSEARFEIEKVEVNENQPFFKDNLFIQPAVLKKLKKELYLFFDKQFTEEKVRISELLQAEPGNKADKKPVNQNTKVISDRSRLCFSGFPFLSSGDIKEGKCHIEGDFKILPLSPLVFESTEFLSVLEERISKEPEQKFLLGLNNIGHLFLMKKFEKFENVFFYSDFYIYIANRFSPEFLKGEGKEPLFYYHWLEDNEQGFQKLKTSLVNSAVLIKTEDSFKPPLFISRGCFNKNNLTSDCPPACKKNFTFSLRLRDKRFTLRIKNCINLLSF